VLLGFFVSTIVDLAIGVSSLSVHVCRKGFDPTCQHALVLICGMAGYWVQGYLFFQLLRPINIPFLLSTHVTSCWAIVGFAYSMLQIFSVFYDVYECLVPGVEHIRHVFTKVTV